MERFSLSDVQAQAILDMRLARLQGLEREKIENEYAELQKKIKYYKSLLADEKKLMAVVADEMQEIKEKWADERRTKITAAVDEFDEADLIEEENVAVTLTHLGYIKRIPADTYRTQKRGGKGIMGITKHRQYKEELFNLRFQNAIGQLSNTSRIKEVRRTITRILTVLQPRLQII